MQSEVSLAKPQKGGSRGGGLKKWILVLVAIVIVLTAVLVPVGVVVVGKHNNSASEKANSRTGSDTSASSSSSSGTPSSSASSTSSRTTSSASPSSSASSQDTNSIPASANGTILDPRTWLDTTDFNTTYTNETVGGLSVMGLNSTWSDNARANPNVPALNEAWTYGQKAIHGVNLGGWLSLEPFITPSLFNYSPSEGVVDEYTLVSKLGPSLAAETLEKHYSTFVTEQTFADIAAAGLDHVRIPYSYWAVTVYEGDPYVPKISWRYLLRGIEWARKHGLRVNLDLHALPGSQNGWNHSGRQGLVGWLNGTDGSLNAQRSLDIHAQLSQFFSQKRYDNVLTFYGLVNEPNMVEIGIDTVINWNVEAVQVIRKNGLTQYLTFGDGFLALSNWTHRFHGVDDKLVMDTHQYMIFNVDELKFTHQGKINQACDSWGPVLSEAVDTSTGWGPVFSGEWSQADTDCGLSLNGVNVGSRWIGTLGDGAPPDCPLENSQCSCDIPDGDPSQYPDEYRTYLKMYAEAQMDALEKTWGWFYWTWYTETLTQWSWSRGLEAGLLPNPAYLPSFACNASVPDFGTLGLAESF